MFLFDPSTQIMKQIKTIGDIPTARTGHSSITFGNLFIIFGGNGDDSYFNDLYFYYPETDKFV